MPKLMPLSLTFRIITFVSLIEIRPNPVSRAVEGFVDAVGDASPHVLKFSSVVADLFTC